jgi:MarR family 2-MHQ and catechol resistance regulon transcriptional repressor
MGTHHRGPAAEVRALDVFIKLERATGTLEALLHRQRAEKGFTPTQFGVMETLYHLGPLTQRVLGGKLLKSGGNLTLVVDNLERDGLVRRDRSAQDRRVVTVHLTDRGRERIRRSFPSHARLVAELLAHLDPREQEQLGKLCKKLGLALTSRGARVKTQSRR